MPKSGGKISLEDLLKAKRMEKPSDTFWAQFERELQRKERRLLQKQPVEDCEMEVDSWSRLKRISAVVCATVSSGAFGLILLSNLGPSALNTASNSDGQETLVVSNEIQVQENASLLQVKRKEMAQEAERPEAAYFEVAAIGEPENVSEVLEPKMENSVTPLLASASVDVETDFAAPFPEERFTTEPATTFAAFNLETATASNAFVDYTSPLLQKYQHPLSDKGYAYGYESISVERKTPLDKMTSMAIEANLFERDTRWGLKLDTVTLKF